MLPKSHRFSFKKGAPRHIYSTPLFVVRYDTSDGSGLHAAVVVGKKVDKKAVVRNHYKRQVLEALKTLLPDTLNINIVIFAKKEIANVQKEYLYEELKKAFHNIHTLK
jgi:ribonuclease P protein component